MERDARSSAIKVFPCFQSLDSPNCTVQRTKGLFLGHIILVICSLYLLPFNVCPTLLLNKRQNGPTWKKKFRWTVRGRTWGNGVVYHAMVMLGIKTYCIIVKKPVSRKDKFRCRCPGSDHKDMGDQFNNNPESIYQEDLNHALPITSLV